MKNRLNGWQHQKAVERERPKRPTLTPALKVKRREWLADHTIRLHLLQYNEQERR